MLVSQRVKIYYRTPDFVSVKQYCNMYQYLIESLASSCMMNRLKYKVPVMIAK